MFQISLDNFRGFYHQDFVEISPITILVGENSAGKSSFLCAIKYIYDFMSGRSEPNFNKDPFQIGTFQQISHYRGGKAGRAKQFSIATRSLAQPRRRGKRNAEEASPVQIELEFSSLESQAALSVIKIESRSEKLHFHFSGDKNRLEFIDASGEKHDISTQRRHPMFSRTEIQRYWRFILQDMRHPYFFGEDEKSDAQIDENVEHSINRLIDLADSAADEFESNVDATSPIRTKPSRTYTPGTETQDGEGSHVPFEIAKLYRSRSKDGWKQLKADLENFGHSSDLFKEISVKSFGGTASDPFQIQFSSDGPRTNIMDLGYGTSQVLPIIYGISSSRKSSVHLIQQPEVHLHPKAQAALGSYFVEAYRSDRKHFILETHSDYLIDRIRNAVSTKKINASDVNILFFERHRLENTIISIRLDENGDPISPPKSYREFFLQEQLRMIGVG